MKTTLEKHSWWITIILLCFVGVLSFISSWQFKRVVELPMIYETKEENRIMREGDADKLERELDRIHTRQSQLEKKIDHVQDGVSEVKTLLIQMKRDNEG